MITRSRLHDLLDRAVRFPLTIVTAPAGYGKTSLLSHWASLQHVPVAWYTLDEGDNSLEQFLMGLVGAIQRQVPFVGSETASLLRFGADVSPRQLAASLVDELLAIDETIVVVLDDLHEVTDRDTLEFIAAIVELPPPSLRLIVSSRSTPDLHLVALRARGRVFELGVAELAFSTPEGERFLTDGAGLDAPDSTIASLIESHDGWFAGLHMAAVAMTMRVSARDQEHTPARASSIEFLGRDVLDAQSEGMRGFLIRIALPTRVSPGLAETLAGDITGGMDARALLDRACNLGLFLTPLGDDGEWYRFHPLFRDMLLSRLATDIGPEGVRDLDRRASVWFAAHGSVDDAIHHALAAGDINTACALVVDNAQGALVEDRWLELELWLAMLPAERIQGDPDLLMAKAWVGQARGRQGEIQTAGTQAARLLGEPQSELEASHVAILQAELSLLGVFGINDAGHMDAAIDASRRAFTALRGTQRFSELVSVLFYPAYLGLRDRSAATALVEDLVAPTVVPTDRFSRLRVLWARTAQTLLAGRDGNVHTLADCSRLILSGARELDAERLVAQGDFFLGSILYEADDLAAAERHLRAATANPSSGILVLVGAVTRLAATLDAQGRSAEADEAIESLLDRLLESEATAHLPTVRAAWARLALARGDLAAARSLIDAASAPRNTPDVMSVVATPVLRALVLASTDTPEDLDETDAILAGLETRPDTSHWFATRLQARLVRALLQHRRGERDRAMRTLNESLADAERTGHLRSIVELGPNVEALLRWYASETGSHTYARRALDTYRADADRHGAPPQAVQPPRRLPAVTLPLDVEPLTAREEDVLSGMQRRLSNKEIASELFVSPLTIKSHARRIYTKLDVNTRRQAVRRAIELGLLEQSSTV